MFAKHFHIQIAMGLNHSGQPVKGESLLNILFDPRAQFGVFLLPAQQPGAQISASLGGVAPKTFCSASRNVDCGA